MKSLITGDEDTKESQSFKLDLCYENGVPLEAYAQVKVHMGEYDTDGSGSYSASEYQKAIDSLSSKLSIGQKSALWQILTGNTTTANNPYGTLSSAPIAKAYENRREKNSAKTNTIYPGQKKTVKNKYPGQK